MKNVFRDFLSFSSGERKGIIVLILIIICISVVNMYVVFHKPAAISPDKIPFPEDVLAFEQSLAASPDHNFDFTDSIAEPPVLFYFDPNAVSAEELRKLGLNSKLIITYMNYRSKGGKFYCKEDLKKIYGFNQQLYAQLKDYAVIGEKAFPPEKRIVLPEVTGTRTIDINHADTALFEELPGIGPVLANRIVRYRSLLGGYYEVQQLREVYGISDSLFTAIMGKLSTDSAGLRKINLNKTTEKELSRHPYIGKYIAKGIITYRTKVKTITNINELKTNGLVTEEMLEKLKNYLVF